MDVIADLVEEHEHLEGILSGLDDGQWAAPSAAAGWTIADVVLHLAQTDEAVVQSCDLGRDEPGAMNTWTGLANGPDDTVDAAVARWVEAERADGETVFARFRSAWRASIDALRATDPDTRVPWAAAPLRPQVLATTRIAEHWAHGLDITEPLGIGFPDSARLRHVAWLGHRTLPYALSLVGEGAQDVRAELVGPGGERWSYGPDDAASTISGPAGAFCRVGAQRLAPEDSGLVTTGPVGALALKVLRNYAA